MLFFVVFVYGLEHNFVVVIRIQCNLNLIFSLNRHQSVGEKEGKKKKL